MVSPVLRVAVRIVLVAVMVRAWLEALSEPVRYSSGLYGAVTGLSPVSLSAAARAPS